MRNYGFIVLLLAIAFVGCSPGSSPDSDAGITLVRDGEAAAVVLIPDEAGRRERRPAAIAARELTVAVGKATGARLPVLPESELGSVDPDAARVWVGMFGADSLEAETILIETRGTDLFLRGGDRAPDGSPVSGTLGAVYTFLEDYLGVRWLFPGELGEVVPLRSTLTIPAVRRKERPLVELRRIRNSKARGRRSALEETLSRWDVSEEAWQQLSGDADAREWRRRQRLGGRIPDIFGHSFDGWWEEYGADHPDFFALQSDGTREQRPPRERLCVSNPELQDSVAAVRIRELNARPGRGGVSICPNDAGMNNEFCVCERCRSWDAPGAPESLSDRYFRFYTEVARRIRARRPDARVACYAYARYRSPPVTLQKLEPNLVVGLVSLDPDAIRAWSKLARELVVRPNVLWDADGFGLPRDPSRHLAEQVKLAVAHGVRAFDFDGCVGNWGTQGLSYYVLARALRDPGLEVDEVIDDYCRAAFGPADTRMREYFVALEEIDQEIRTTGRYRGRKENPEVLAEIYSPERLERLDGFLDDARAALVGGYEREAARIQMVADGLEYARLVVHAFGSAGSAARASDGKPVREAGRGLEEYLKAHVDSPAVSAPHVWWSLRQALATLSRPQRTR